MTDTPSNSDKLLADTNALNEAYAQAADSPAEHYNRDLLELVSSARLVVESWEKNTLAHAVHCLAMSLEQFEPWLEQDEDPRSMGWVDDRGRP